MSFKFVVFMYLIIPMLLAVLTYATLLDLVGKILAIAAGCLVTMLWCFAFCNMLGLPIRWDK
jgi:ABC-type transporter Mla maintaining outer membrane lipid asymmetry permease subunit MlaE